MTTLHATTAIIETLSLFAIIRYRQIITADFDAVTTVSEEAINPEKNIGRAIIITYLAAGVIFIVVSYVFQLA